MSTVGYLAYLQDQQDQLFPPLKLYTPFILDLSKIIVDYAVGYPPLLAVEHWVWNDIVLELQLSWKNIETALETNSKYLETWNFYGSIQAQVASTLFDRSDSDSTHTIGGRILQIFCRVR